MNARLLRSGDRVLHPIFGFGVVEGMTTRSHEGKATRYYNVRLAEGAMLSVPLARASTLGLRLLTMGLATVVAYLRSPAHPLPDAYRQRAAELRASSDAPQLATLVEAMRDLLGRSRTRRLTPQDQRWLTNAHERLSREVAFVEGIEQGEAHTAIQNEMEQLKQLSAD